MARHPLFGMGLAVAGALILSPDTLLMRLSGLGGPEMMAWRGLLMALVMTMVWVASSRDRRADLGLIATPAGLGAMALQGVNGMAFVSGVAVAPVAVVLFAVATVPVWGVIFGALFLGDRAGPATALTSLVVLVGIGLSVSGGHGGAGGDPLLGALAGLAVAMALAGSFTLYRANPGLPVLLTVGWGAVIPGTVGLSLADDPWVSGGRLVAIALTGAVIVPVSFYLLSIASRHTKAANVSLFLLLETVLGPILVWAVTGEAVGPAGLAGGAIVVGALAVYLLRERRISRSSA